MNSTVKAVRKGLLARPRRHSDGALPTSIPFERLLPLLSYVLKLVLVTPRWGSTNKDSVLVFLSITTVKVESKHALISFFFSFPFAAPKLERFFVSIRFHPQMGAQVENYSTTFPKKALGQRW